MKSIRHIAYAAILALTALSLTTSLVWAEDAHGSFTLLHDVRWLNAFVPAGKYIFSYDGMNQGGLLMLHKISGGATSYIMFVRDVEGDTPTDIRNQLLLQSTPAGTFVNAMYLPRFGLTLRFPVQSESEEQSFRVIDTSLMSAR